MGRPNGVIATRDLATLLMNELGAALSSVQHWWHFTHPEKPLGSFLPELVAPVFMRLRYGAPSELGGLTTQALQQGKSLAWILAAARRSRDAPENSEKGIWTLTQYDQPAMSDGGAALLQINHAASLESQLPVIAEAVCGFVADALRAQEYDDWQAAWTATGDARAWAGYLSGAAGIRGQVKQLEVVAKVAAKKQASHAGVMSGKSRPAGTVKEQVEECWREEFLSSGKYPVRTIFTMKMMKRWPVELANSVDVVPGWCTQWKKKEEAKKKSRN